MINDEIYNDLLSLLEKWFILLLCNQKRAYLVHYFIRGKQLANPDKMWKLKRTFIYFILLRLFKKIFYVSCAAWSSPFHPSVPSLIPFPHFVKLIGIDPVQIWAPPIRNRTIPVLRSIEKRNRVNSFWNCDIPDPDQIGSGDGCSSSTWAIETGWRWNRLAETIRNNQHNTKNYLASDYSFY